MNTDVGVDGRQSRQLGNELNQKGMQGIKVEYAILLFGCSTSLTSEWKENICDFFLEPNRKGQKMGILGSKRVTNYQGSKNQTQLGYIYIYMINYML